jgi:hypothetical protein
MFAIPIQSSAAVFAAIRNPAAERAAAIYQCTAMGRLSAAMEAMEKSRTGSMASIARNAEIKPLSFRIPTVFDGIHAAAFKGVRHV